MIRWSAHLSLLFRELPFAERPAAARRAGFASVESWWPEPQVADAFAGEVSRNELAFACLNCFGGDIERGDRGFLNVRDRHDRTLSDFADAVAYAQRIGARRINVLVGRELPGVPRAPQLDVATATLRAIAGEAAAAGITVLVESLNANDVPGSLVPSPPDAVALIEKVGSDSVALLFDAYHAAAAGCDPVATASAFVDLIGHVQYADFPGRGAPGSGSVDLGRLVEALDRAGYEGAIGLEFEPRGWTPALDEIVATYDRAMGGKL